MKKYAFMRMSLAIVCVLCLLFSLSSASLAGSASLNSTQGFIDFVESQGLEYQLEGMLEDRKVVMITFGNMNNFDTLSCVLDFYDNCKEVSLWMWNIVKVNKSIDKSEILNVINVLNYTFKYAKFIYDETDSTVYAQIDMCIDENHCGRPVFEAMYTLFSEVDSDLLANILHTLE